MTVRYAYKLLCPTGLKFTNIFHLLRLMGKTYLHASSQGWCSVCHCVLQDRQDHYSETEKNFSVMESWVTNIFHLLRCYTGVPFCHFPIHDLATVEHWTNILI